MHRDMHAHSLSVSHTHTHTYEWGGGGDVSRINTGKVQYVHVIYPKFMKMEQNEGRDHTGSKWKSMQKSTALL